VTHVVTLLRPRSLDITTNESTHIKLRLPGADGLCDGRRAGWIEVGAVTKDGSVEVSVSDTGVGIAPEQPEDLEVRYELNHDVLAMDASRLVGPLPSFLRGHGLIRS
jgi:hypothetical protein